MTAIAYDLPLKNFIAELDATGHVSHTQHRKTHVTLHHNGGRLSHEGVLNVWRVRPASAQFNIDAAGTAAQYVRVVEYAWACGSTDGNQRSISIEMCNATTAPSWEVSSVTWRGAARLAGWLFARVIGARPTRETLVRHKYWSSTECAGPHIDRVYDQILVLTQQHYDAFVNGKTAEDDMSWDEVLVNPKDKNPGKASTWLIDANDAAVKAKNNSQAALDEIKAVRAEIKAGFANLSGAEAKIVEAIRAQPTGGQVDTEDLAARLREALGDALADELAERLGRI